MNTPSVPELSPFRYPGGKTWLVPYVRKWLKSLSQKPNLFLEPFAGGGIISLTVANEDLADRVLMVEIDEGVSAVWDTIINRRTGGQWLAKRILAFDPTPDTVRIELSTNGHTGRELAFQTILKNRVSRGGILAPGAGLIRNGENKRGLKSRWYPETLSKRVITISQLRHKIGFQRGDGMELLKRRIRSTSTCFFIDPPYSAAGKKAGKRLYTYSDVDHTEVFEIASRLSGDFLMTYNNAAEIRKLVREFGFKYRTVQMKNTHHHQMEELIIGRDLEWLANTNNRL